MSERINNFVTKVQEVGKANSMALIFFPILFLVFTGVILNNAQANNMQTTPVITGYPCVIGVGSCSLIATPANPTGCLASMSNCNISKVNSIQFLNDNSPFTLLIQGNIVAFFSSVFNGGEVSNHIYSGYTTCIPLNGNNFFNATGQAIYSFMCQGISSVNNTNFKPNAGVPMNATSNGGNNSIWDIVGCQANSNFNYPCLVNGTSDGEASWNGTNSLGTFYAFYVKNGTAIGHGASCTIFSTNPACQIVMPWLYVGGVTTFTCPSTHHVNGLNINATYYYCLLPVVNPSVGSTGSDSLPNSFAGLSFLFGALLFFLGFGTAITSAIIGFQINAQGTRLAQVFGIGLLAFGFLSSEFGSWLYVLPLNLGDIATIALAVIFFFGLYWRLFSID
jgi:hypothetical protein